ncbi:hypothetical protein KFL_001730110 [Klebsormidium nitens]|uniref:Uncharacterized protein n=1 Tax=Klebsormidium nitens TaxID=105231 RepID=A0A1Y1I5L8_KLENI|nr:hypothetical protein KFL_001730110 [Klebsormidium nitens]|eukprot:GAQ84017.1 hypothetical protein KFL_001730110 [Klebsormidium nitens]
MDRVKALLNRVRRIFRRDETKVASPLCDTLGCGTGFPELRPSAQLNKPLVHLSPVLRTVEVCKGRLEHLPANVRHHTSLHKKVTIEHAEGKKEAASGSASALTAGAMIHSVTIGAGHSRGHAELRMQLSSHDFCEEDNFLSSLSLCNSDLKDGTKLGMIPELEAALPRTWNARVLAQHILETGLVVVMAVNVGTLRQQSGSKTEELGGRRAATNTKASLGATTPDGTGLSAGVEFGSSAAASGEHKEEVTRADEHGTADDAVVFTATTVLQSELVRDEARRRLLEDAIKWIQAAANRWCLNQVVDGSGTPFSLSRVPHFDLAAYLDFQRVKQTSQATSETWRQYVSETELGTAGAAGSPVSVKAGSEFLFQEMSRFGMARRFYVNTDPVRFTGGVPVGIKLWITGIDNDTLELCIERTNQLPDILVRAGFASRMEGGEWHPGRSALSRYVKFKGMNVDCAEVSYSEQQQGKVHVLTGARLAITKAKPGDSAPVLSIKGHYSVLEGARLITSQWEPSRRTPSASTGTPSGSSSRGLPTLSSLSGVSVAETQGSTTTSCEGNESDEREVDRERQQESKLGRYVRLASLTRGPDRQPGYWLLTGVALDVDPAKVLQLRARFSLFEFPTEEVERGS